MILLVRPPKPNDFDKKMMEHREAVEENVRVGRGKPFEKRDAWKNYKKKILLIVAALSLVLSNSSIGNSASETDRATVMQACEAEFGPPVDQKNGLFEVDRYFVLEARFDENGRLVQLGILPKHWFGDAHPEWDEAEDVGELTETQYELLLRRLDNLQPRGPLLTHDKWPVVKGTTARRRDIYKRAVVVTGDVVDSTRPDDAPRTIKYLIVYFNSAM